MWHRSSSSGRFVRTALLLLLAGGVASCQTLSVEKERELGREFEQKISEDTRMLYDEVIESYITAIGNDMGF